MSVFLEPTLILDQLELRDDMRVAEFGAGAGAFTLPIAQRFPKGMVYAFDVQRDVLETLRGKAEAVNFHHIELRHADLEKPGATKLKDASLDIVFIPNMLFQVEDRTAVLREASRILHPKGQVVVIDWHAATAVCPKEGCMHPDELKKTAAAASLRFEKELTAGRYHYALVFTKKPGA